MAAAAGSASGQGYPSPPVDFSHTPWGSDVGPLFSPTGGTTSRRLLVLYLQFSDVDYTGHDAAWLAGVFFGPRPSVADYYATVSRNHLHFLPAAESSGVFNDGVVVLPSGPRAAWDRNRPALLAAADPFVNYASFDLDHNGAVDDRELLVFLVVGDGGGGGQGFGTSVFMDGVWIVSLAAGASGPPGSYMTYAHELAHAAFDHFDMYGFGIGHYDVMGPSPDPDTSPSAPFWMPSALTRLRLGWIVPTVVDHDGWRTLTRADRSGDALLLYDPARGPGDYFLAENREGGGADSYDRLPADNGIVIYRVHPLSVSGPPDGLTSIEVLQPDGSRTAPAISGEATLTADVTIGTTLPIDNELLLPDGHRVPYDVLIDEPGVVNDEEIVHVVGVARRTLTLSTHPARSHRSGAKVIWHSDNFAGFAVTALTSRARRGTSSLAVGRVVGTVPSPPFDAKLGERTVHVSEVSGASWRLSAPLLHAQDAGTQVRHEALVGAIDAGPNSAWDPSDLHTPNTDMVGAWRDGTNARVSLLAIGPHADVVRVYADVPGPGLLIYPPRSVRVATAPADTPIPFTVRNTGEATSTFQFTLSDGAGRSWGPVSQVLRPEENVNLTIAAPPLSPPPPGYRLNLEGHDTRTPAIRDSTPVYLDYGGSDPYDSMEFPRIPSPATGTAWTVTNYDPLITASSPTAPGATQQVWRMTISNLVLQPSVGRDRFAIHVPDPGAEVPNVFPGFPMPECGNGPYPVGGIRPEIVSFAGRLRIVVTPRDGYVPSNTTLTLQGPTTASPTVTSSILSLTRDCPRRTMGGTPINIVIRDSSPATTRVSWRYNLFVEYSISITRSVASPPPGGG